MDKLKFWKKEEDKFAELDAQLGTLQTTPGKMPGIEMPPTGLESSNYADMDEIMRSREIGMDTDTQETGGTGFSGFGTEHPKEKRQSAYQPQSSYEIVQPQQTQSQTQSSGMQQQQLELISAKLDTIRVSLESVNHRLVALEHALQVQDYQEVETPRRRRGVW